MSMTIQEAFERLNQELIVIPAGSLIGYRPVIVDGEQKNIPVHTEKVEFVKLTVDLPKFCGLLLGSVHSSGGRKVGGALSARHVRGTRQKAAGGRS